MSDTRVDSLPAGFEAGAGLGTAGPPRPVIQIVPLKGLPIVAVVIGFLVASIGFNWEWGLDFNHVAGGGLWTGIDLFVGLVVGPILGRLSIPARAEFSAKFMPKMVLVMPTLVAMTLASGFQLALNLGNLKASNPNHAWLMVSFIVVGVMAVIALGILEPANIRDAQAQAGRRGDREADEAFHLHRRHHRPDADRNARHHDPGGLPMSVSNPEAPAGVTSQPRFAPVAELGAAALVLVVAGGIYMASYAPRRPPLTVPICLAAASGVLLAVNVVMLMRTRELAWDKFFLVGRWTLLSYVIAAGLIEFAFVRDHTRGGPLVVLTAMLVLFAVNVPLIISFTVARFQSARSDAT